MKRHRSFLIAVICLVLGFIATISPGQQAQGDLSVEYLNAGAKLVVTSVSGPATAIHNQYISVTYNVKNQGTVASGSYSVRLYLSTDNKIDPAADRLLDKVKFSNGLAPGESRKATAKVLVPINGLSGNYYYGAVVASSKKASAKQVSLVRYSLADDNDTVKDHQTGLTWQQTDDGETRIWDAANQYCAELALGGYEDWRLPSIDEVHTIIDYSRYGPTIEPVFESRSSIYWSSTTYVDNPDDAWNVNFNSGYVIVGNKTFGYYVRCARGGPVPQTVPGAPTGVAAAAGDTQATVTFTAPASDGGSPITSYAVTSSPGSVTATGASSPITVTGLTNGTAYIFTVTATNAVGTGLASSPSNSVTPVAPGRYVNNGNETVTDTNTGLMWQKADDETQRDWADAGQYCENLELGGYDDWRLPRVDELETIVDHSRTNPAIDPIFDACYLYYWSGSTAANVPSDAWYVGFSIGYVGPNYKPDNDNYVRCVRGEPSWPFDPSIHLQTPSGKPGTVIDTYWGYIWQKGDSGGTGMDWVQAKAYCDSLELDGDSDWRLPEIEALQTIVDYTRAAPAWSTIFDPRRSAYYWSSSVYAGDADDAWHVYFGNGLVAATAKPDNDNYVRCVRSGP